MNFGSLRDDLLMPVVDLFFPKPELRGEIAPVLEPLCDRCGEPFDGQILTPFSCARCREMEPQFDRARSGYLSRGAVRYAVHEFKYYEQYWLRHQLVEWLEDGFARFFRGAGHAALVPVPLHPLRRRWREFNQAQVVADGLSRRVGLPVWNCLRRIRETEVQATLDREDRLENLRGAFALAKGWSVRDTDLLMIDDILTTGTTVSECALTLKAAGARRVDVLTVARG